MIDRENVINRITNILNEVKDEDFLMLPICATVDVLNDALELLKGQESLKQKMWNALYDEEDKLENHYIDTGEIDKWIVDYRPFLQRGFEIAIEVISAHEEGGEAG